MIVGKGTRFRAGLRFTNGDRPGIVIVHDPVADKRIELNEVDCLTLRAMEGTRDLDEGTEKARAVIPTATREEVERVVRELAAYGVLEDGDVAERDAPKTDAPDLPDANAWQPTLSATKPARRFGPLHGAALAAVLGIGLAQVIEVERVVEAPATRDHGAPVVVLVREQDVALIAMGAPVTLHALLAPDAPVRGKIVERAGRVEVVDGEHVVRFTTDITDPSLLEGMSGTASIAAGSERLLRRMTRWGHRLLFG